MSTYALAYVSYLLKYSNEPSPSKIPHTYEESASSGTLFNESFSLVNRGRELK